MTEENDTPDLLTITAEPGPTTTLALNGDLDPATAPLLQEEVDKAFADPSVTRLVLDLGGLQFLDSSGLRVFVAARDLAKERGGELALRAVSPNTERLLSITGLSEVIEVEG